MARLRIHPPICADAARRRVLSCGRNRCYFCACPERSPFLPTMRFLDHSPDIPDELIRAVRDGAVVFLCGAGVSFKAGLPTFRVLTEQVYAKLGEDLNYEHAETNAFNEGE